MVNRRTAFPRKKGEAVLFCGQKVSENYQSEKMREKERIKEHKKEYT
ncbi:hypothetical protein ACTQ50_09845 [Blautia sp. Sow4_E7]